MDNIELKILKLPDKMNIRSINEIHQTISHSIISNKSVEMYVLPTAEVDLSFVQVIEAARIQAKSSGVSLALSNPAEGMLLDVLERGGFLRSPKADDQKFWLHREAMQ